METKNPILLSLKERLRRYEESFPQEFQKRVGKYVDVYSLTYLSSNVLATTVKDLVTTMDLHGRHFMFGQYDTITIGYEKGLIPSLFISAFGREGLYGAFAFDILVYLGLGYLTKRAVDKALEPDEKWDKHPRMKKILTKMNETPVLKHAPQYLFLLGSTYKRIEAISSWI